MSKKEIANKDNTLPAHLQASAMPDGAGFEGADAESFAIPFLTVVQKGSPICDETDAAYNPDARPGQLMNSVTGALHDGREIGVEFIPVAYRRRFLKWGARATGGGFMGEFTAQEIDRMVENGTITRIDGQLFEPLPDGTVDDKACPRYRDTRMHFGLLVAPDAPPQQILLSLTSTQIKKSKALMAMLRLRTAPDGRPLPTFASVVNIKTVPESNDQGSWYGVKFEIVRYTTEQEFAAAKEFHDAVLGGEVETDFDKAEETKVVDDKF